MSTLIIIEDYDALWPQRFEILRSRLSAVLDPLAFTIEHVGSTAVPGLAAKPILDIDVLLLSAPDFPLVVKKLEALGYEHQGDLGISGREAFRTPPNEIPHHLYVCLPECPEFRRHLLFRDYLRSHPEDALIYSELKRQLASRYADDREAYTLAKTEFVERILHRAQPARTEHSAPAERTIF